MNTLETKLSEPLACGIEFDEEMLHIQLIDGRVISVPLEYFPKLRDATNKQREKWSLIGKGLGIHWKDIDEDISVENLLI